MSRTRKFVINTLATALLQMVHFVSGFILPKVMLSAYGSEINGLISSITQLIAYITLVEAGLSGATIYSLYKPIADRDQSKINSILAAARIFYHKTGYLFLGLAVGLAFVYPLFIQTKALSYGEIAFLFLVLGVNGVLEFFTLAKYRALLTADQKTYVVSLASIVAVIINVTIVAVLSFTGMSIVWVRLVAIAALLIRTIILRLYCRRKYGFLDFSVTPDYSSMSKRWDALYLQIIGVIHNGAPVLIATFLLSLKDVSIYSIYYIVISGINSLLSIFISGLAAGFGDLLARGDQTAFRKSFKQFEYSYYMLITIVYSIMFVTYLPFIEVYTAGADIQYSFPILAILMTLNGYLYNLKTPFGMLTISAGKYRESRVQITIQGALEIVFGIALGLIWGLNGIVIGSIISNLYRDIDFIFFAPKHLTHFSFRDTLLMWSRSVGIFAVVVMVSTLISNDHVASYLTWVTYAAIVAVIAVSMTLAVNILTDSGSFKSVLQRIRKL